jgi:hypothetical protein
MRNTRAPKSSSQSEQSGCWRASVVLASIAVLLFLLFHPWSHYQWATLRDRVPSYESFVTRFPDSDYKQSAQERIRVLREPEVWSQATEANQIEFFRSYIHVYPDGKHLHEAKAQAAALANAQWNLICETNSKSTVSRFLSEYPETTMAAEAEARIVTIADAQWRLIANTDSKTEVLRFLNEYPETTKRSEAESRVVAIADAQWRRIASSRSVPEINRFLSEYPETTMRAEAERRIQELYNDWNWVREQDSIGHYQNFAARNPLHPERKWIEKRIIDLEVAQIASGEHGELPRAQSLSSGGATVELEVENRTSYELTVRYSGPDSKKLVIPPGETRTASLLPGDYQVAASVSAASVRNYYGSDSMRGGRYSSSFYIESSYGGISIPTYRPRRR